MKFIFTLFKALHWPINSHGKDFCQLFTKSVLTNEDIALKIAEQKNQFGFSKLDKTRVK